jgi:hypothetical protein
MTLPKILATLLATGLVAAALPAPTFAANGNDGITNGTPSTGPADPAAQPQQRKHRHRHHRRQPGATNGNGSPAGAPAPQTQQ